MGDSRHTHVASTRRKAQCGHSSFPQANNQEESMGYCRTPEHRRLRAELIHKWKPWTLSTGPKTPEGKARVARNADRGGDRQTLRSLARVLREREKRRKEPTP